tara:strand:+ start:342 stop:614 length:273 start_codon:yes stop_codon:yes gene_type:complete
MEIQIQNIQKARDTVLSSSFYPMDEKFNIIRHKFTNYDQLASKLEVEFKNNRMERTRHYKVLVTNTALEIAKVFPSLFEASKRWYVKKVK